MRVDVLSIKIVQNVNGYMQPLRCIPFSCPPGHSIRPHFIIFHFLKALHCPKSQTVGKKMHFNASKWDVRLFSLKFYQISVPRASNWTKNQFFKIPNLVAVQSPSPYFGPFGPHTHTKMKVEYPQAFYTVSPRKSRPRKILTYMVLCKIVC